MPSSPSPEVHTVTTARRSLAEDQDYRARQYFVLMGIRTLCFLVALLLAICFPGWYALLFFFAAAAIPYVAVVLANAVNPHEEGEVTTVDAAALPAGRGPLLLEDGSVRHPDVPDDGDDHDLSPKPEVHVGEVVAVVDHGPARDDQHEGENDAAAGAAR